MRVLDLAVLVHQQIGAVAVQHAGAAAGNRGGVQLRQAVARGFDAEDLDRGIVEERMEQAHRVGAAADAGDQRDPAAGLRPPASAARVSLPMIDWKSRTIIG